MNKNQRAIMTNILARQFNDVPREYANMELTQYTDGKWIYYIQPPYGKKDACILKDSNGRFGCITIYRNKKYPTFFVNANAAQKVLNQIALDKHWRVWEE